jgi:hypothetical protein
VSVYAETKSQCVGQMGRAQVQQRGLEHEKAYIESLRSKGLVIVDLSNEAEEVQAKQRGQP